MSFKRWKRKKPDISHLRTFGCEAFAWIHGYLTKKLDNNAYKCVLLGCSETATQYPVMDFNSGRVFIARDVKFDESTLYHQLLKIKSTKFSFEPAKQDEDLEIEDEPRTPPKAMRPSPKAKVLPPKATALPLAINLIDDSDDDLPPPPGTTPPESPPPEIPPPKPRRSGRTAANVSIISKKYFRPGGLAPSEWTRSVRAVRETPVADYSAPGVNSTRRVPYRPLIAVSPFLLVLSVSYFKRSLCHCG
jgi:hypothetical protein